MPRKLEHHADVLQNRAPDPYQYKMFAIEHAFELVARRTGIPLETVYYAGTCVALGLLVLAHHLWLLSVAGREGALAGSLALGALANTLFLTYVHHPHEPWGVALYCLLLAGVARGWRIRALAPIALVAGFVFDKHALVPVLWGVLRLVRGDRLLPTAGRALVFLAASLAGFVGTRLFLGTDRDHVDGWTTLALQEWDKVLWYQVPFLLPFVAILALRFRALPTWVRLLWLTAPALYGAYVQQGFILHEVRSFWALAPVFTATLACAWPVEGAPRNTAVARA
jgi:hypothetical protein